MWVFTARLDGLNARRRRPYAANSKREGLLAFQEARGDIMSLWPHCAFALATMQRRQHFSKQRLRFGDIRRGFETCEQVPPI